MEDVWKKAKHELKNELPEHFNKPFINSLKTKGGELGPRGIDDKFILEVADKNVLSELQESYQEPIQTKLGSLMGRKVTVEFKLTEEKTVEPIEIRKNTQETGSFKPTPWLNPAYSFATFIKSKSNELAFMAAESVAIKPGTANPLFIYGESGLGKTHLTHAIARETLERNPEASIYYTTIEDFKNEFLSYLKNKRNIEFKNKYKSFDCLFIEDIHSLRSAAEATQEEFYYIFNHYFESGKQVIITSEIPPSRLLISSRLMSRLIAGLQVRIEATDEELRQKFTKKKLKEIGLTLNSSVENYLTSRVTGNIRELESATNKLFFLNSQGVDINDLSLVGSHLAELIPMAQTGPYPLERIMLVVCERYSISKDQILGASRKAEFTLPRHIAMYLGVKYSNLNKSAIARFFRKNDHTTVINAERNIQKRQQNDPGFTMILDSIMEEVRKGHF